MLACGGISAKTAKAQDTVVINNNDFGFGGFLFGGDLIAQRMRAFADNIRARGEFIRRVGEYEKLHAKRGESTQKPTTKELDN